jgi:hypothetical protein
MIMAVVYLCGFVLFATGILIGNEIILKTAAVLLLLSAILYNGNVWKAATHKPKVS